MAQETCQRNVSNDKPLVALMDGQESLWQATQAYLPQDNLVPILDLLHVTPRLWKAAYLFHPQQSPAAVDFVKERTLRILQGEVRSVLMGLRRMGTSHHLRGNKRKSLDKICNYFEKNAHRMRYDEYLAAGYPIASGVIEGACRHLVKDRMERAGMRWVLSGAQPMINLRSIPISGLWDEFIAYRIQKERKRLYPYSQFTEAITWPLAA